MIVIALGGNALVKKGEKLSVSTQINNVRKAMKSIARVIKKNAVVITHGSGPQIGSLMLQNEVAKKSVPPMPLYVLDAEVQGELGYLIEQALQNELKKTRTKKSVVSLLTQVLVDKKDKAFKNPTKPIGPFYKKKEAALLQKKGMKIKKVVGGYRRIVASPKPKKVIESSIIRNLTKSAVVIAVGGGGIPVYKKGNSLKGIDAVIDKDLASACLANSIKADTFLILTDVDCVYLDYEKNKKAIKKMDIEKALRYKKEGHFPEGSMGPKIQAAVNFLQNGGKKVIITSPSMVEKAMKGKAGTIITK